MGLGKFLDVRNSANQTLLRLQESTGNIGIGSANPLRTVQIGPSINALFTLSPSDVSPNAGFIRFGDHTGWKLHLGRNREMSAGPLNTGTSGVLMTLHDNGNLGVGTTAPQAKLEVRGDVKLGGSGQFFATSGAENLRIVRGAVDGSGNIVAGSGFTVFHPRTGGYQIQFNPQFAGRETVTASVQGINRNIAVNRFGVDTLIIFVAESGELVDFNWEFIAVGPR
jgi:hypothetical protein